MILFIIPIKPHINDSVWYLLRNTLRSIFNIDGYIQVITVSNTRMQIYGELNIITDKRHPEKPEFDKLEKIKIGFEKSHLFNPKYVMVFDYDDYISSKLFTYIGETNNGYYMDSGYIYENQQELFLMSSGFYNYCGSSLIVRPNYLPELLDHNIYNHFQNSFLEPIYDPLVVYNRCNGENLIATKQFDKSRLICL